MLLSAETLFPRRLASNFEVVSHFLHTLPKKAQDEICPHTHTCTRSCPPLMHRGHKMLYKLITPRGAHRYIFKCPCKMKKFGCCCCPLFLLLLLLAKSSCHQYADCSNTKNGKLQFSSTCIHAIHSHGARTQYRLELDTDDEL